MFERGSYTLFVLVCIIMYIVIFKIIDKLPKWMTDWQYICLSGCKGDKDEVCQILTKNMRDQHYWIDPNGFKKMNPIECKFTMYEFTHLLFHTWIGYEYGLVESITLSVFFEAFEHIFYDCGSVLDMFWNLIGGLIGFSLKYYTQKR